MTKRFQNPFCAYSLCIISFFFCDLGYARILKFRPSRILIPQRRRVQTPSRVSQIQSQPTQLAQVPQTHNTPNPTSPSLPTPNIPTEEAKPRPIVENSEKNAKILPFGRSPAEAFRNRPKLFQTQKPNSDLDPYIKIFCENPYQLVCETTMDEVQGESWPGEIFPRTPAGAFSSGKKILDYLTDHHFEYNDPSKQAIKAQLQNTQILVTQIGGPMAFSQPPQIQVPPTYWNLFSVFHELGHMIDFKSTYPIDKGEVIQVIRRTSSISDIDAIEKQIASKQAEITADKIAAKGFAFLADPHIRKLGFEPINTSSLLKTIKAATGFLCGSPGGEEHPSGRFRINYMGADPDLRAVLGCPVSK